MIRDIRGASLAHQLFPFGSVHRVVHCLMCITEYRGIVHCFRMHTRISFSASHRSLSKLHPMFIIARLLVCTWTLRLGNQKEFFISSCQVYLQYMRNCINFVEAGTRFLYLKKKSKIHAIDDHLKKQCSAYLMVQLFFLGQHLFFSGSRANILYKKNYNGVSKALN